MRKVFNGRYTADLNGTELAVFLIGMRFNKPLRLTSWVPVFRAMPRILRHLATDQESGLLSYETWFGRTTLLMSYWQSADHLIRFAGDSTAPHAAAWREFNRRIGADGSVGIWHETYLIGPGRAEAIYANMPAFGLARATDHVPVTKANTSARRRLAK
jgi:Monooxygenase af470-like